MSVSFRRTRGTLTRSAPAQDRSRRIAALAFLFVAFAITATHAAAPALTVTVRDAKGAPVADAVVSLHALDENLARSIQVASIDPPAVIVQRDQEFLPYVTVIRVGTRVEFPNEDDIQHHIYSVSKPKRFEKPLYNPGAREAIVFDQPGIVTLGCNIHDWMVAYVVVLPTPLFGQTDAAGLTRLTAPPGRYRVEVWHPRQTKPQQEELTWPAGDARRSYTLTLKPDRRIRRAPENKTGGY